MEHLEQIGSGNLDHCNEWHIYGPPGCAKTTNTARQVRRAVSRFGKERVMLTSFSTAAAAELGGKDLDLPKRAIGTLHSHCFHALGMPKVAEGEVKHCNLEHPTLQITPQRSEAKMDGEESADGDKGGDCTGDEWLGQLNRLRGRMIQRELWPLNVRKFETMWCEFKTQMGAVDFTDLIEFAHRDVKIAPGDPAVVFSDETQDFNKLMVETVSAWGR